MRNKTLMFLEKLPRPYCNHLYAAAVLSKQESGQLQCFHKTSELEKVIRDREAARNPISWDFPLNPDEPEEETPDICDDFRG